MSRSRAAALLPLALLAVLLVAAAPSPARAAGAGLIYAPLYQTALIDYRGRTLELAATLYVRNVDPKAGLEIRAITLYNGAGTQVAKLLAAPRQLAPLATLRMLVPQVSPARGGPSLVVEWRSAEGKNPPLVEVLIMGAAGQQGISLTTTGTPLPPP